MNSLSASLRGATLAAVGIVLALITPAVTTTAHAADTSGPYVALGDSYVSGPGIPQQDSSGCARSDNNYPHVVAKTLNITDFTDASCGGATTNELTAPQFHNGQQINAPQLDALTPETKIVTLGIGGNDIGFGSIVNTCVGLATASQQAHQGNPCQQHYTAGGVDQLAAKIVETAPKVVTVLREIAQRAPQATTYVVGYPTILPTNGDGCFPDVPLAIGDVPYLRDVVIGGLNSMLAAAARDTGATYVDTANPTQGHDMCQPTGDRYVEGPLATPPAAPVHPNALGMAAVGGVVVKAIDPSEPIITPTSAVPDNSQGTGGGELSKTGAAVGGTIAAGALLLAIGVAITMLSQRRRRP